MATNSLGIGGAETHIVDLARALRARGHYVVIVSYGGEYADIISEEGIRHITAPLNIRSLSSMIASYQILKRTVESERIEILHAHARIPAFLCARIAKKRGIPFVTTVHGAFKVNVFYRKFSRWGDHLLAVSPDLKKYIIDNYGIAADKITLTVNGIETDRFLPAAKTDVNRIVHIGRLEGDTSKTAFALTRVIVGLRKNHPNARLVITGYGATYEELTNIAAAVNEEYPGAIELTGARTDVENVLADGGIFVGTSRAALEAMSCSLPVILCGEAGYMGIFSKDMLGSAMDCNFTCRGYPQLEESCLERDIEAVMQTGAAELAEAGEFNRAAVERCYSVSRMCDDAEAVYRSVVPQPEKQPVTVK